MDHATGLSSSRMDEFRQFLSNQRQSWTNVIINIAFMSKDPEDTAFMVKSMRGLKTKAIRTPCGTQEAVMYRYPDHTSIRVWDIPWVVGDSVKEETFKCYDIICVLASDISQEELNLIAALKKCNINHTLVYLDEDKAQNGEKSTFMAILKEKVKSAVDTLKYKGGSADQFCDQISVVPKSNSSFQNILDGMLQTLPPTKQEALLLGSTANTKDKIAAKKKLLKERMWMASLMSSTVPGETGSTVSCDMEILIEEISFLVKQFGLDPDSLHELATASGTSLRYLRCHCKPWVTILMGQIDRDTITRLFQILGSTGLRLAAAMGANVENPSVEVLFPLMSFPVSFGTTFYMLNKLIDMLATEAQSVVQRAKECSGAECGFEPKSNGPALDDNKDPSELE